MPPRRMRAQMFNDMWTVVSSTFSEEDAKAYVRMNWLEMTPKTVAQGLREFHPKFKDLTDEQFELLYKRYTVEEFFERKAAFLEQEAKDAELEAIREKEKAELQEALDAAKAAEIA